MILEEEEQAQVERTEHLMSVVVEMRKRHGVACVDYSQRASAVEWQLLKLSLDEVAGANFKPKTSVPEVDVEEAMKDLREFDAELEEYWKRVEDLQSRVKNTRGVVETMRRADPVFGAASRRQLSAEALLARAKNKNRE